MINITCKLSKSESFKAQGAFTDPCVAPTGSAMLFDLHLDSFASCIPSHNISSQEGFTLDSMRSPSFGVTESANGAGRPLQRKWSRAHMCKRMVNAALWLDGLLVNKKKHLHFPPWHSVGQRLSSNIMHGLWMLSKQECEDGGICLDSSICVLPRQTAARQIFTRRRSGYICLIRSQSTVDPRHSLGSREGHVLQHHINRCCCLKKLRPT